MRFTKFINRASYRAKERAGNNFSEFSQSRPSCGKTKTKLWQGLLTLPLGRPKVSNPKPGGSYGPAGGGVWRPAPNRQQTAGSGDPRQTANLKSGSYYPGKKVSHP